jgi:hypothetical protein
MLALQIDVRALAGPLPISYSRPLVQNFSQELEAPFLKSKCPIHDVNKTPEELSSEIPMKNSVTYQPCLIKESMPNGWQMAATKATLLTILTASADNASF